MLVKSSLGAEVYALSDMVDHMSTLRDFYEHFMDVSPGIVGPEDCRSCFTRCENATTVTEKVSARRLLAIQEALETQDLGNVNWLPGLGNPANGMAKTKSGMAPLLRLLRPGAYTPGSLPTGQGITPN